MIKLTQNHFDRIIRSISDTEQQIAKNLNGSFLESYCIHLAALRKLLLEIEVVDSLTSDEVFAENERMFHRINFLKGVSV